MNRLRNFILSLLLALTAPAALHANQQGYQSVAATTDESALLSKSVTAGLSKAQAQTWSAEAKSLRKSGIDPTPYLAKWSEGLVKRVPAPRLEAALEQQAERLRAAHRLLAAHHGMGPEAEVAALQLLNAGAREDEITALAQPVAGRKDATARFLSLSFGAARLKNAGATWKESVGFQAGLAGHEFAPQDIDDVNEAMAAAMKDGLVASHELPEVAQKELHSPVAAREFVRAVRRQPHGADRAEEMRANGKDENAKAAKGKDKAEKAKADKQTKTDRGNARSNGKKPVKPAP